MANEVVITGYSQASSLGRDWLEMDHALWAGSAHAEVYEAIIEGLDPIRGPVCRALADTSKLIAPSKVPMDRSTALALMVATGAALEAELDVSALESERLITDCP